MTDDKVEQLLTDLQLTNLSLHELVQEIRSQIYRIVPDVSERVMYGGFMFGGSTQFCGVFAYTKHVSIEFGRGCDLKDSHRVLEGGGKLRRHIKVSRLTDIAEKYVSDYIGLAYQNSLSS